MSRSYGKPVYKDRGLNHRWYNQIYRVNWNRITRGITSHTEDSVDDVDYPQPNAMVNQWDICDYNWNYIGQKLGEWNNDWRKKLTRK